MLDGSTAETDSGSMGTQTSNYYPLGLFIPSPISSGFEFRFLVLPTCHSIGASKVGSRLNSDCR